MKSLARTAIKVFGAAVLLVLGLVGRITRCCRTGTQLCEAFDARVGVNTASSGFARGLGTCGRIGLT